MQTLTLSSNGGHGQLLDSKISLRLRAFRFVSDRFVQRERTGVVAEYLLFAVIVATAMWPMFTLANAFSLTR